MPRERIVVIVVGRYSTQHRIRWIDDALVEHVSEHDFAFAMTKAALDLLACGSHLPRELQFQLVKGT
jgi:hypothetical protein